MTHTEMEEALNNCDRRLSAIEQILPTLATKQDLERFATKQDLERFATKEDLADVRRDLLIRIETLGDKFDMLADGFAAHAVKLEKIDDLAASVASHAVKLDAIGLALGTVLERLDKNSDTLSSLTERLERRGVI